MNAWDNLPNAKHIDWVLASVKSDPTKWDTAWHAAWDAAWGAAWDAAGAAARDAAWVAAQDAGRDAAWDAAWGAAWYAALGAAWGVARGVARGAARDACDALIAWDDCADLLDLPTNAVRLLAGSGHHPAVLLLPAVIVRNGE